MGEYISPEKPTVISRAGVTEKTLGTVLSYQIIFPLLLDYGNGNKVYRKLKFTVIDIPYDLIIGRNHFELFGFVLNELPVKPPGPQVTATDDLIPPIEQDTLKAPPVIDTRFIEALERNAAINPSKEPCTDPLPILELYFSEVPTHDSRVNYIRVGQEQAVNDFIHEMLENGNIELAPNDAKFCFE
jgi:hypothetical protein